MEEFQFYLSSIKSEMPNQVPETFQSFNSTLVPLKVPTFLLMSVKTQGFNSTLVQLKEAAISPSVVTPTQFQFYLSSIKSWKAA